MLNDGQLLEGNCFNSIPYVMPSLYVNLPYTMAVAELRVTNAYASPGKTMSSQ